jgi:hypothetical protein
MDTPAALFETIVVPGFFILAGAAVLMLLYSKYLERKNNKED